MTAPLPPGWLATDPYPDGPHWPDCERTHPGCAWKAGVRHGQTVAADFILSLARLGDQPERVQALIDASRLVARLAGADLNGDPAVPNPRRALSDAEIAALEAEAARIAAAEARDAADEAADRAALAGACADEADRP